MVIPFRVRRFNRRRALPSIAHSFGDGRPNSNDLRDESDMHIQFRPWCGVKLRRWYRRTPRELDRSDLQIPIS